ncbi:MAG: hypothetical protein K2H14_08450, partial [Muribaculaceae bacterium]|nr:hypothetical protein [Muribaculaceae bacterium]
MKAIRSYMLAGVMAAGALFGHAQDANRSGYFLEGYTYRHALNPALAPERNYVAIPVIGNFGVSAMSNVGVSTFLYQSQAHPGQLTTFLNKEVSADEFLGKLGKNNKLNARLGVNLFSFGFRGLGGYNTVNIGTRVEAGTNLPKDLFTFMKLGQTGPNTRYDFKNIRLKASGYAEIALGHQHKINKELSIGAKVKFLLGLAHLDANIKTMDVTLGHDKWAVRAQGEMSIGAGSGFYVPTNKESGKELDKMEKWNQIDYNGIEYNSFGLAGFGLGFDLGAVYDMSRFVDGLTLSASLLDLGWIGWNNAVKARTPETSWEFSGFNEIAIMEDQESQGYKNLEDQMEDMWDGLEDISSFEKVGNGGNTTALAATFSLGAEYKMPFYNKLTGAFLFSTHIAGVQSW